MQNNNRYHFTNVDDDKNCLRCAIETEMFFLTSSTCCWCSNYLKVRIFFSSIFLCFTWTVSWFQFDRFPVLDCTPMTVGKGADAGTGIDVTAVATVERAMVIGSGTDAMMPTIMLTDVKRNITVKFDGVIKFYDYALTISLHFCRVCCCRFSWSLWLLWVCFFIPLRTTWSHSTFVRLWDLVSTYYAKFFSSVSCG